MRAQVRLAWIVAAALILVGGVAAFLLEQDGAAPLPMAVGATGHAKKGEPTPPPSDRDPVSTAEPAVEKPAATESEQPARAPIEEEIGVDLALVTR